MLQTPILEGGLLGLTSSPNPVRLKQGERLEDRYGKIGIASVAAAMVAMNFPPQRSTSLELTTSLVAAAMQRQEA